MSVLTSRRRFLAVPGEFHSRGQDIQWIENHGNFVHVSLARWTSVRTSPEPGDRGARTFGVGVTLKPVLAVHFPTEDTTSCAGERTRGR